MLKKVLLTSFLLVFEEGTRERIAMAVLIAGVFLLLHVRYQPYHSAVHNRLETVALTALTLVYFIGLLIKADGAQQSTVAGAFDAILLALIAAVVLAAVLLVYISRQAAHEASDSGSYGQHEENASKGSCGQLVANERGLRLTNCSSLSIGGGSSLGESLLGSVAESDDGEDSGATELAHERLRSARLEAELSKAQGEKGQAQREKEQMRRAKEQAQQEKEEAQHKEMQAQSEKAELATQLRQLLEQQQEQPPSQQQEV
jgi:hypothetical protein